MTLGNLVYREFWPLRDEVVANPRIVFSDHSFNDGPRSLQSMRSQCDGKKWLQ